MRVELSVFNPNGNYDGYQKILVEGEDYENIDNIQYTVTALNSRSAGTQLSFSENITFVNDIVNILKDIFIFSEVSIESYVKIKVYDDCCGVDILLSDAVLTREDLQFCLEEDNKRICRITTDVRATDASARNYVCIRSSLINKDITWDNGDVFKYQNHPSIPYCNNFRPAAIKVLLQFLVTITLITMYMTSFLILWIDLMLQAVNFVLDLLGQDTIDLDSSRGGDQTLKQLINRLVNTELVQLISGCGFWHYSPLIRSYIQNVCLQCGNLNFSSSILNDSQSDYYNLAMMGPTFRRGNAPVYDGNGNLNRKLVDRFWKFNVPNITGGELLDNLAAVFNAEWWVEDNTIYFEQQVINVEPILRTSNKNLDITSICLETEEDSTYSGIRVRFQSDGIDTVGNEALFQYSDIVPFYDDSDRYLEVKRKLRDEEFKFGPTRFEGDGLDEDEWAIERLVEEFFFLVLKLYSIYGAISRPENKDVVLLEKDVTALPKLIILEDGYDRTSAKALRDGGDYNYPMWVSARAYGGIWANSDPPESPKTPKAPNLWQFWQSADTRLVASKLHNYQITLELKKDCGWYADFMTPVTGEISKKYFIEVEIEDVFYLATFDSIQISSENALINATII